MFAKNPSTEGNQQIQAMLDALREESNDTYPPFKEFKPCIEVFCGYGSVQ